MKRENNDLGNQKAFSEAGVADDQAEFRRFWWYSARSRSLSSLQSEVERVERIVQWRIGKFT
jgi:hypothetical protein